MNKFFKLRLGFCKSIRQEVDYYLDRDGDEQAFWYPTAEGEISGWTAGYFRSFEDAESYWRKNRDKLLAEGARSNPGLQLLDVTVTAPQSPDGSIRFQILWEFGWPQGGESGWATLVGAG